MIKLEGKSILLISPEPWGTNFVSKHHYANYLAQKNTVYFLNPPVGSALLGRNRMDIKLEPITENLTVIDYKNLKPKLNKLPKKMQGLTYDRQAKIIEEKLKVDCFDIVWSFDPHRFTNQKSWNASKSIYHSVDFHPNATRELEIIASSDFYFGIADLIIDSVSSQKKAIKIGHGADLNGFKKIAEVQIPGSNIIKAMYVGNFHKHIDYELLNKLSEENSDVDFILIGPTSVSNLSGKAHVDSVTANFDACPNIYFIGSVPSDMLMSYLVKANINLVLFQEERAKLHCNPHKIMSYFYSGKVVLSSYIDEYKTASEDLIIMEKSNDLIPKRFKAIKANLSGHNSKELQSLRKNFAVINSYENKINQISEIITAST